MSKLVLAITLMLSIASCSSSNSGDNMSGDTGDSTSLGAGPDTSGSTVDTGSSVTDTASN